MLCMHMESLNLSQHRLKSGAFAMGNMALPQASSPKIAGSWVSISSTLQSTADRHFSSLGFAVLKELIALLVPT